MSTIIPTKGIKLDLKDDKINFKQKMLNADMNVINELDDDLSRNISSESSLSLDSSSKSPVIERKGKAQSNLNLGDISKIADLGKDSKRVKPKV